MDVGALRHLVTLQNPGVAVADGEGGYTEVPASLSPSQVWASIVPATGREMERVAVVANTVETAATHIVRMRYHPGVTIKTRVLFGGGTLFVTGMENVDERNVELILVCTKQL
jgi:head-tail adaptor